MGDLQTTLEEEQRNVDEIREQYNMSERRATMLSNEVQELRSGYEQAERLRRSAEGDASDAAKRKLEADLQNATSDIEDLTHELKAADERAKKGQMDVSRLSEELRSEQEHSQTIERRCKTVEHQFKELTIRFEDGSGGDSRGSKKNLEKLEAKLRELENEKNSESIGKTEAIKQLRKVERRMKELAFSAEEEKKEKEKQIELLDRSNKKGLALKRQIEELEDANNQALARLRKFQHDVDEADERAEMAEQQLAKLRAKSRATSGPSTGWVSPFTLSSSLRSHAATNPLLPTATATNSQTANNTTTGASPKTTPRSSFNLISRRMALTSTTQPVTQSPVPHALSNTNLNNSHRNNNLSCQNGLSPRDSGGSYSTSSSAAMPSGRRRRRSSGGRCTSHEDLAEVATAAAAIQKTANCSSSYNESLIFNSSSSLMNE